MKKCGYKQRGLKLNRQEQNSSYKKRLRKIRIRELKKLQKARTVKYTYIVLARENCCEGDCGYREETCKKPNITALSTDENELNQLYRRTTV